MINTTVLISREEQRERKTKKGQHAELFPLLPKTQPCKLLHFKQLEGLTLSVALDTTSALGNVHKHGNVMEGGNESNTDFV